MFDNTSFVSKKSPY